MRGAAAGAVLLLVVAAGSSVGFLAAAATGDWPMAVALYVQAFILFCAFIALGKGES